MSRQCAIVAAKFPQSAVGHLEGFSFLVRRFVPVVVEPQRHRGSREPGDDVPVQIDCIQFDMHDRVEQGDTPGGAARPSSRHVARRQQFRAVGARRMQGRCRRSGRDRVVFAGARGNPERRVSMDKSVFSQASEVERTSAATSARDWGMSKGPFDKGGKPAGSWRHSVALADGASQ